MPPKKPIKPAKPARPATIHEATLGPHGVVLRGVKITEIQAVARRKSGGDVVVCGDDIRANRVKALEIEDLVGPWVHHFKHRLGPDSLPHYQPIHAARRTLFLRTDARIEKIETSMKYFLPDLFVRGPTRGTSTKPDGA